MKHYSKRSIIYLALIDFVWYFFALILFFTSFYAPIADVLQQAYEALQQNTQALSQNADALTNQISLEPHAQLLVNYILLFTSIVAFVGILIEFIKTKIIYKKVFWLKTIGIQVAQFILFMAMLALSNYLLYIQFSESVIPMWLMIVLLTSLWSLFFWFVAQAKAKLYVKKKFKSQSLWLVYGLLGLCILLASIQYYELVILASLFWLIGWNWINLHIASFK